MSEGTLWLTGYSTLETRRLAVRAVVDEGLPITAVARAHCTDRSTIHRWIIRFRREGEAGPHRPGAQAGAQRAGVARGLRDSRGRVRRGHLDRKSVV